MRHAAHFRFTVVHRIEALLLAVVLMFLVHQLQLAQERLALDTETYVNDRLIRLMQRSFKDVWGLASQRGVDLRTAALMRGIERVAEAKRRRGVFP